MEFAITLKGDMSLERTLKLVKRAEEGGFDYVWFFDSHVLWPDCYPTMTACMRETKRLRFGPCVTNPGVRHISVAASTFAALQKISDGRFDLGIGRGDSSLRMLGRKPCTIDELVQFTDAAKALVRGETVHWEHHTIHLTWAEHEMPAWFAAYGPKALAATGRHADGLIIQLSDPWLVNWFTQQALVARPSTAAPLRVQVAAPVWVGPVEDGRRQTRWFPGMVGNHVADLVERYGAHGGTVPRRLTDYIEGRKGYDYKKHADKDAEHLSFISDEIIDSFSMVGDARNHVERLKELEACGVTQFNIYLMCGEEERILEEYIQNVIPQFQLAPA